VRTPCNIELSASCFIQVRFPEAAPAGLVVLLVDEATCSDGEIFAAAFRSMKLGPIVGMRTWGGVAGISSVRPAALSPPLTPTSGGHQLHRTVSDINS
jgi:C-terminal processing protease CtpA/Prc